MASDWIRTVQNELLFAPNIRKCRVANRQLIIEHTAGAETQYTYENKTDAQTAFNDLSAVLGADTVGEPVIISISPVQVDNAGAFPVVLAISGIAFDATALIVIQNYSSTVALVTTFVNSTALTAPIAAAPGLGTYDVVYSDSNGKMFRLPSALLLY